MTVLVCCAFKPGHAGWAAAGALAFFAEATPCRVNLQLVVGEPLGEPAAPEPQCHIGAVKRPVTATTGQWARREWGEAAGNCTAWVRGRELGSGHFAVYVCWGELGECWGEGWEWWRRYSGEVTISGLSCRVCCYGSATRSDHQGSRVQFSPI